MEQSDFLNYSNLRMEVPFWARKVVGIPITILSFLFSWASLTTSALGGSAMTTVGVGGRG